MKSEEAAVEAAKVCSSGSDLLHELTEENDIVYSGRSR